ncbi:MAG: hypothetical protein FWF82_01570 [Oscillospiraceae bacterium]|jgi:hypothetical protein|nr:hypothetical protein [Oscillospiraceae bacterium]
MIDLEALFMSLTLSLAMTLFLEIGFYITCNIVGGKKPPLKDFLLVVLVNVMTNPAVVLIYWLSTAFTDYTVFVIIPLEIAAVLVEGYFYKKYGREFKKPYLFSLAANAFSYGTGLLLGFLMLYS